MKNKTELTDTLKEFSLPAYSEIPDVGLYLEQVARYINGYLSAFPDMEVTTSMISNYAKQKLFDRVNKKTYTREQIAVLIFIVMTKTVLSIDRIRMILQEIRSSETDIPQYYDTFRMMLKDVLESFSDSSATLQKRMSTDTDKMLENVVITIGHKMYLEKYFDLSETVSE